MNPFGLIINMENPDCLGIVTAGKSTSVSPDESLAVEFEKILSGSLSGQQSLSLLNELAEEKDPYRKCSLQNLSICHPAFNPVFPQTLQPSMESGPDSEVFADAVSPQTAEMKEIMQFNIQPARPESGSLSEVVNEFSDSDLKSTLDVQNHELVKGKGSEHIYPVQKAGNNAGFLKSPIDLINNNTIEEHFTINLPANADGQAKDLADDVSLSTRMTGQMQLKGGDVEPAGVVFNPEGKAHKKYRDPISDEVLNRVERYVNIKEIRLSDKTVAVQPGSPEEDVLTLNEKAASGSKTVQLPAERENITANKQSTPDKSEPIIKQFNNLIEHTPGKSSGVDPVTVSSPEVSKADAAESRMETAPVRFILPDKIDQNQVRNNHTIFIKLEPEHLGTVRLTLSSQSHGVTGRLVVDNAIIQSVVESNLNSLLDDLSDRGIKLDAFQVSVGGGQIGRRFAHSKASPGGKRQTEWSNRLKEPEKLNHAGGNTPVDRLYIGTTGVNWLA